MKLLLFCTTKTMSMSQHSHQEDDTRSFTLTAFLSFAAVFCFLLLMAQCHGPFKPGANEKATTGQAAHHE